MITSSGLKEEGFVGGEFLSVTPHKSCWPVNKNVVRARPLSGSPEGPVEMETGPGHNIRKTRGEDVGTEVTVRLVRSPLRDCAQSFK